MKLASTAIIITQSVTFISLDGQTSITVECSTLLIVTHWSEYANDRVLTIYGSGVF